MSDTRSAPSLPQRAPVGVAVLDTRLHFCAINEQMAEISGLAPAQHIGRRLDEVLPPPLAARIGEVVRGVSAHGTPVQDMALRHRSATDDGEREWRLSCHPVWGEAAQPVGVLLTACDAGRPARSAAAAAAAAAVDELVQRVLDNLAAFVAVLDADGTLREINRAPLQVAGVGKEEVLGLKFWDCPWWQHDPGLRSQIEAYCARAAQGETIRVELTACTRQGKRVPLDFMLAPLRDAQGRVTHLVPSAIDITERKHSEEALRANAVLFRSVVESAPNGLAMVNEHGEMTLLNSKMEDLFGYERGELLGCPIDMLVPVSLRERHAEQRAQYHGAGKAPVKAGARELHARRKDGSQFPVEVGLVPVDTPEGPQTIAAVMDVSEHKQAQRALESALRQKTALLHEVHHRVKNNLQVISSLLSLQARTAGPEAREVLAESQSRVKAMALTHQLLYEREDFSNVHMGVYLQRLVELLRQGHAGQRRDIEVQVDVGDEELPLDLQRALPCALLITELVINAFKHAFPNLRPGRLSVTLRREGRDDAVIEVADNGVGIPPGLEMGQAQSLGFQLLPMLADQIGAQLTLHREHGTRFTIRLPIQMQPNPEPQDGDDTELKQ